MRALGSMGLPGGALDSVELDSKTCCFCRRCSHAHGMLSVSGLIGVAWGGRIERLVTSYNFIAQTQISKVESSRTSIS